MFMNILLAAGTLGGMFWVVILFAYLKDTVGAAIGILAAIGFIGLFVVCLTILMGGAK